MSAPGALPAQAAQRHIATAGVDERLQISVALLLVTLPAELDTTTENIAPLSVLAVAAVVYRACVAPATAVPLRRH